MVEVANPNPIKVIPKVKWMHSAYAAQLMAVTKSSSFVTAGGAIMVLDDNMPEIGAFDGPNAAAIKGLVRSRERGVIKAALDHGIKVTLNSKVKWMHSAHAVAVTKSSFVTADGAIMVIDDNMPQTGAFDEPNAAAIKGLIRSRERAVIKATLDHGINPKEAVKS